MLNSDWTLLESAGITSTTAGAGWKPCMQKVQVVLLLMYIIIHSDKFLLKNHHEIVSYLSGFILGSCQTFPQGFVEICQFH